MDHTTMSQPMKKMLLYVGIVFGIIFSWYLVKKLLFIYFMSHYVPPPVTISATTAKATTWHSYISTVGTLTAVNGVDVSAEAPGIVREIHFESGQFVKKGDVLILLDTSIEQAQLKDNLAQLKLAQLNYDRNKALVAKNAVSQAELDRLTSVLQEAQAGVEQIQAKINQKTITAPFDGKIGIRLVDLGQFISAGTTIGSLQSLDPLYVKFNLPEQYLSDLYLQQPIELSITLRTEKKIMGTINAINSKVDQTTRNILVQGTIPNKDFQFYPGMFTLVKVILKEQKQVVILPQTAISYSLHGDSVFIIKEEGKDSKNHPILKAYRQYITVGEQQKDNIAILEGVKAGDRVVTSGQLKLQNGTHVEIDNSVEL